jgi:hypothetical protein
MELKYLSIGRKVVKFAVSTPVDPDNDSSPTEECSISSRQAPLIDLTNAFSKLAPIMCAICEWPQEYAEFLSVTRITISHTKAGTRSVKFTATKQLNCRRDFLHTFDSPMVQIDKPAEGESGEVQVDKKHSELIKKAIREAERYAKGERSKTLLAIDEADAALQATADVGKNEDMFASANA